MAEEELGETAVAFSSLFQLLLYYFWPKKNKENNWFLIIQGV